METETENEHWIALEKNEKICRKCNNAPPQVIVASLPKNAKLSSYRHIYTCIKCANSEYPGDYQLDPKEEAESFTHKAVQFRRLAVQFAASWNEQKTAETLKSLQQHWEGSIKEQEKQSLEEMVYLFNNPEKRLEKLSQLSEEAKKKNDILKLYQIHATTHVLVSFLRTQFGKKKSLQKKKHELEKGLVLLTTTKAEDLKNQIQLPLPLIEVDRVLPEKELPRPRTPLLHKRRYACLSVLCFPAEDAKSGNAGGIKQIRPVCSRCSDAISI